MPETAAPPAAAPPKSATAPPAAPPPKPAGSAEPPAAGDKPPVQGSGWLDSVGEDLNNLDSDIVKPVKDKADDDKGAKPADKLGDVTPPDNADKPPAKPDEPPAKPVKAAELRTAYENLKKEKKEVYEPKIQQLEAKIKELETRTPDDAKPLVEKMTALEKRNQELEQHMQFVDYQKSTEFKDKYQQPYTEAWTKAVSDFSQLTVSVQDGVDDQGDPKITTRPATADDLLYLANLPLSEMDKEAVKMFDNSAARVIRHVERVKELSDAQNRALSEAQKKGGEWVKERQARSQADMQKQQSLWTQYNKEITERFPAMFGPEEGDVKGNELLKKGFELADRLFAPKADTKPETPEERVQFHALLRNKIANHDRMVLRNKRLQAELADAKKALSEYENSAPTAGKAGKGKAPAKTFDQEVEEELRALDKP